ncbi:hypothetical protein ACFWMQ_24940 [Streptomyces sp. NPDC058372]|uniref:hypothetical protein n=1 Tax=Streptomyces sp. NPDC058372 TaxID=3346464 RepID=UPI003647F874
MYSTRLSRRALRVPERGADPVVVLSLIRDELAMDASAGRAALLAERRSTVPVKDGLNRRPGWGSGAAPS